MRIQANAAQTKPPAEASRFDRVMTGEANGKKGAQSAQTAVQSQKAKKSVSKDARAAFSEAAGQSFGKKSADGKSAGGKGADAKAFAGEGGFTKSAAFAKGAAALKSAGAQIQSQVQTQLQSLKSALTAATGMGQSEAAGKADSAKSAQAGPEGSGARTAGTAGTPPSAANTATAARTGAETTTMADTGGRATVANAEANANPALRSTPAETGQQADMRTHSEFIEAQADPNGLLAANPHGMMVHGGGQNQAVPLVIYRLGENAVGADAVIVNADGTGMIMGEGIEIALNGGDFDAQGNWIAAEGHGVVGGQAVDLTPNDDGDVFIAIGDGTSTVHVNARMSDGAELSADVVAVEQV